ncbi:integrase [Nocardioides sp. BE266]|uniref:tyrosine-type recombinase/integrase n=1 Tax=Nocardioides sp. BE266 TaxID=2817725 RepID=UPI002864673E|nr:site-specific integrase [Nocardioides sp. BE266]MDR7252758.1 integrase [Nocardioides sp. BE266]
MHVTGATYRVQRSRGTHTLRASFKTLAEANAYALAIEAAWAAGAIAPSVDEFRAGFVAPGERTTLDPSVPTRLNDLVERAITAHQNNKHLAADGVPKKMRAHWAKHGAFFNNVDVRNLTREQVHRFADHLYVNRLSRLTANEYIRLVRMACDMAMELKIVPTNVARGVVGRVQDNPLTQRDRVQPRPLTPTEVKTFAAQFPDWLQVGVLLMYVGCLRISEVFGVELRDWDPFTRTLRVRRQGGLQKNEGRRDPSRPDDADGKLKTKSSRRTIPIAPVLAEVIDRHIEAQHGPRPLDTDLEHEWLKRRLISTEGLPKPRQGVVIARWQGALRDVGLDFDTVGFKIGRHFLRKSGSTVIGIGNIRGKLWSAYLGHETPAEFGGSLTTVRHYFDLPDEELIVVAERWEDVIRSELSDLFISPALADTPHMTQKEAALTLGVHETHVGWMVRQGHLLLAPAEEVEGLRHKTGTRRFKNRILVSGPSVRAELERRTALMPNMSEKDVARELAISIHYVQTLRNRGLLTAERGRDKAWQYDVEVVRTISSLLELERSESHLYMATGEAARCFGLTNYEFERAIADRLRSRTLLVSQQRQYLRADVEQQKERRAG